eukprot:CAMPEP_0172535332 /NCGR_PEP_ID=MMETSP1067-20121228/7393_1 /TAXON_ID=265564 ORGANISM="Thalassiosira punctigera, Strain Tpunct2005C2" /NCGR_SAMPLE_ID=MMETSP1067 /ASSEMBLY_ACC=CAM_ASM_000444 /LENGTH=642 /DNA_ID=CAMNT_0013320263 /DNA_START=160 /DNA_END=2088 /DNA_ORIENTATION=-
MSLTPNAVRTMFGMNASQDNPSFAPTLQVIHLKKIDNKGAGQDERWKVILSDGTHFLSGMCATQLNNLVHSGAVAQNCILRVNEFIVNTMGSGQKIVIVLGAEQAGPNPGDRIGAPTDVAKSPAAAVTPQSQAGGGSAQSMYGGAPQAGGGGNPYGRPSPGGGSGGNPYGGGGGNRYGQMGGGGVSSAPIVRTSATGQQITPIAGLNMYSNRWVIRAKVSSKSSVRNWSNARGEGSLFSAELLDSSGTDVKCTFFKEAVDKWYSFLEEGQVYTFSGGRLKVANMQYNTCKSQFEITFDQNSEIHLDEQGGPEIRESYDFVKIASLESVEPNAYVDILAVVKHVGEPTTIVSKKSGKELLKCELTVEDDSGAEVRMTMWGDTAQTAQQKFGNSPIVAFKRARVSDYGGRTLSGQNFVVQPNIPQANGLRQWWAVNGNKSQSRSLSSAIGGNRGPDPFPQRKDVSSIKSEGLGHGEKPDWLTFKATITFIKKEKQGDEGAWYTACANADDPCRNMFKATQTSDGNWHCDKCQRTHDTCVRRFIFSGTVADDTSTSWVSVFNEQAETLFNGEAKADHLYEQLINGDGRDLYDSTFMKATYTDWLIKCKVKQELVGDEQRVKTSVVSLSPVDYAVESKNLLASLFA